MPLTDKQILALRSTEGRVTKASDGGGLQLWVTPSGGRLWNFAYRFVGKQRKLAIGRYPTVSLNSPLMKSRFFSFASGLWRG